MGVESAGMHARTNLIAHVVFSTKARQRWITPELCSRLYPYMNTIIQRHEGYPIALNGTDDHVHILARFPADEALSAIVSSVKASSSGWVHATFPLLRGFAWQSGYAAFSVSSSGVARVAKYIADQERPHRRRSFLEELELLLRAHGIPATSSLATTA